MRPARRSPPRDLRTRVKEAVDRLVNSSRCWTRVSKSRRSPPGPGSWVLVNDLDAAWSDHAVDGVRYPRLPWAGRSCSWGNPPATRERAVGAWPTAEALAGNLVNALGEAGLLVPLAIFRPPTAPSVRSRLNWRPRGRCESVPTGGAIGRGGTGWRGLRVRAASRRWPTWPARSVRCRGRQDASRRGADGVGHAWGKGKPPKTCGLRHEPGPGAGALSGRAAWSQPSWPRLAAGENRQDPCGHLGGVRGRRSWQSWGDQFAVSYRFHHQHCGHPAGGLGWGAHLLALPKPQHLYYATIARRDGVAVIKKKCPGGSSNGGTYYDLAARADLGRITPRAVDPGHRIQPVLLRRHAAAGYSGRTRRGPARWDAPRQHGRDRHARSHT